MRSGAWLALTWASCQREAAVTSMVNGRRRERRGRSITRNMTGSITRVVLRVKFTTLQCYNVDRPLHIHYYGMMSLDMEPNCYVGYPFH